MTGAVLRFFTGVSVPWHLSLDSEGHLLVADYRNDRILLLNSQLELQRVLIDNNSQVELRYPTLLCYSETLKTLYIAHYSCTGRGRFPASDTISVFKLL